MKILLSLLIILLLSGCAEKSLPKGAQTHTLMPKETTHRQPEQAAEQAATHQTAEKKEAGVKKSRKVKKVLVHKSQKTAAVTHQKKHPSRVESKQKSLQSAAVKKPLHPVEAEQTTSSKVTFDQNRHLFIVGKELEPLNAIFSRLLLIQKDQNKNLATLKELLQQEEVKSQSTYITFLTLADFLKEEPLEHTLSAIENLPTKKSFFIILYNHEKNLRPLLENKLLNGLKNVLLFIHLEHKRAIQNEPAIQKLINSMRRESVTFKQLHDALCDTHTKECSHYIRGNDYLLY